MKDDLLKALFHIGAKDPGTLARILEEEDPLGASANYPPRLFHAQCRSCFFVGSGLIVIFAVGLRGGI